MNPSELYARLQRLHAEQVQESERLVQAIQEATAQGARGYERDSLLHALEQTMTKATRLQTLHKLPPEVIGHAADALSVYEGGSASSDHPTAKRLVAEISAPSGVWDRGYEPDPNVTSAMAKALTVVDGWAEAQRREALHIPEPAPKPNTDDGLSPFERASQAWLEAAESEN